MEDAIEGYENPLKDGLEKLSTRVMLAKREIAKAVVG